MACPYCRTACPGCQTPRGNSIRTPFTQFSGGNGGFTGAAGAARASGPCPQNAWNRGFGVSSRSGSACPGRGRPGSPCPSAQCSSDVRCSQNRNAAAAATTAALARNARCAADQAAANCCRGGSPVVRQAACVEPIGCQLYGGTAAAAPVYTTCCDPCVGLLEYRLDGRDPFWPAFARPRWLSCDELYGRSNRRRT